MIDLRVCFVAIALLPVVASAQPDTAYRTGLGTFLGTGADGTPRYREDSGWDSPNYNKAQWGIEFASELNGGNPWTAVLQSGRTNAAFSASAGLLTFDLGGQTYVVKPFASAGVPVGGKFSVTDAAGTGAYLKITNGTFDNNFGSASRTVVGENGLAGRLFVEGATLKTYAIDLGNGDGSSGTLTVDAGGAVTASNGLNVGNGGTGSLVLRGTGASVTASEITVGFVGGTGAITVNGAGAVLRASNATGGTGDLLILNPSGSPAALIVSNGLVQVDGSLRLAPNGSVQHAAVLINGGTVKVGGIIGIGNNTSVTNGGRITLDGGRLEIVDASSVAFGANPEVRKFYWKTGTLAFSGPAATLSQTQLRNFTAQGATTYGGDRAAGKLGTGQTVDAAGTLTLNTGTVGLSGGTIKAANGLVVNSSLSGYGTVDAIVSGGGTVAATGPQALALGGLSGATGVSSTGAELRVGHLGANVVHSGTVTAGGQVVKTGVGSQTFQGTLQANDGFRVEAGGAIFDGGSLTTAPLKVSAGASARFQNGGTGTAGTVTLDAGAAPGTSGRLTVDGASSRLTASSVTNNGWIELTNGGVLVVGAAANPGSLVNTGLLINNGGLTANVTGGGRIGGSGTFGGGVTIAGGATLTPGNSPGTASFHDLTLGAGGLFELELAAATGAAGLNWDLAAVGNLLNVAATAADPFKVVLKSLTAGFAPGALAGFDQSQSYSWKFASVNGPANVAGFDASKFLVDATAFTAFNPQTTGSFTVTARNDGLYANYNANPAAVPEPGSLALLTALAIGAGVVRVRSRRKTPV